MFELEDDGYVYGCVLVDSIGGSMGIWFSSFFQLIFLPNLILNSIPTIIAQPLH